MNEQFYKDSIEILDNMSTEEFVESFRKELLRQAYLDFLDWAWKKDEIMVEWTDYCEDCKELNSEAYNFTDWVTQMYWGELE